MRFLHITWQFLLTRDGFPAGKLRVFSLDKIKHSSSRKWLIIYLVAFIALNLLSIALYTQSSNQNISRHLNVVERFDYKQSLYAQLQENLGLGHYVHQFNLWLSLPAGSKQKREALLELQSDFNELNRLLDLYLSIENLSLSEREAVFKLRQALKEQQQKLSLLRLLQKQNASNREIDQLAQFPLNQFFQPLDALKTSINQQLKETREIAMQSMKDQAWQGAFMSLFFFTVVGVLAYFFVFRRVLFQSMDDYVRYQKAIEEGFGVFKVNSQGEFSYVNNVYCQARGVSKESLIGQPHPMLNQAIYGEIWHRLRHNNSWTGLLSESIVMKGKPVQLTMQTLMFLVSGDERQPEFIGIQFDVTELEKARRLVQEVTQAQAYFLTNIGHQLRSPLSAVMGGVKMLQPENMQPRDRRVIELVLKNSESLLENINALISFADIEGGRAKIENRPHPIKESMKDFFQSYCTEAHKKDIDYTFSVDPKLPECLEFDYKHLSSVLENLLHNAFKYTPEGAQVRAEIRLLWMASGSCKVEFEISDSGIGMENEKAQTIFNRFQRLESIETHQFGGTGIGLSISQKLVKMMGGEPIEVDSFPQQGSSFRFQLQLNVCNSSLEQSPAGKL